MELGLLMIPLVTLAFGITEYGRAMYSYNIIDKGVRDAARYLTQYAPGDAASIKAAKCLVVYGNVGCDGTALAAGLTEDMVTVKDATSNPGTQERQTITVNGLSTGVTDLVTVEVSKYKFNSLVTFVAPNITYGTISSTMFQPANP